MNYIGAKLRLLPFLENAIGSVFSESVEDKIFCDLFAGTGVVGQHFGSKGFSVIANDLEYYSFILNQHKLNPIDKSFIQSKLEELNALSGTDGFFYHHYCDGGKEKRRYFSEENGKKIQAIRDKIDEWKIKKMITDIEHYHLLAIMLKAADKVANTASVYGAYLKHIKKSALAPIQMEIPKIDFPQECKHQIFQQDANILIKKIKGDILYLDPPYNARQYGANYHLLNTLAYNQSFVPKGVTGLPDYTKSQYCSKNLVYQSFKELISQAEFSHIFLSYNNEGLVAQERIVQMMSKYGKVKIFTTPHTRFRADKEDKRKHKATSTVEFLFYLNKR